jgi:hypothetical protein
VDYEVIVVDNASSDGSADAVEQHFAKVRVIRNSENVGFSRANNIAFRAARGRYYLLLNTDTVVLGSPRPVLDFIENTPDAGVVGCRLRFGDGSLQRSGWRYPQLLLEWIYFGIDIVYKVFPFISDLKYRGIDFSKPGGVDCVSGNGMFIKKQVVDTSNGFDPNFFMYYEDTELCLRINKVFGWKVYYLPSFEIMHFHGKSSAKSRATIMAYNSYLYYLEKTESGIIVQLFKLLCKVCWCVDIAILSLLQYLTHSKKASIKILLLMDLLAQYTNDK